MATERVSTQLVTLTMTVKDFDELLEVLHRCSEDFCENRRQNALDLRMQYVRLQMMRDAELEKPASSRRDSTQVLEVTRVDPRHIPDPPRKPRG